MIAAAHIFAGAAVGSATNNYLIGGIVSLILHLVLDMLPYIDVKGGKLKLWQAVGGLSDFYFLDFDILSFS